MTQTQNQSYPVMEHFATIQGEGFFSGSPAYFIRLGGCDVGCHWCDVKESWPIDSHPQMTTEALVDHVLESGLRLAVITGGEPAMHDLTSLCSALSNAGIRVHIETSGTHPLRGKFDWVTFSPKKFKAPLPEFMSLADELKVIIFNKSDFAFAEEHKELVESKAKLFLQPEWDKRDTMIPETIAFIMKHPEWQISLQTHKYMNIP